MPWFYDGFIMALLVSTPADDELLSAPAFDVLVLMHRFFFCFSQTVLMVLGLMTFLVLLLMVC